MNIEVNVEQGSIKCEGRTINEIHDLVMLKGMLYVKFNTYVALTSPKPIINTHLVVILHSIYKGNDSSKTKFWI